MAVQVLDHFKLSWAKLPSPFNFGKLIEHLFHFNIAKQPLNFNCSSNLVRIRLSPFSNLCHALDRVCLADYYELWIHENDWAMCEKSSFKVSCSLLFLLDSWLMARFIENEWCVLDVWCLLSLKVCLIRISGHKIFPRVGEEDEHCHCSFKP